MTVEDDQAKKPEGWPMVEERDEQTAVVPKGHLRWPSKRKVGPASGA
jgi:hypothetical protein